MECLHDTGSSSYRFSTHQSGHTVGRGSLHVPEIILMSDSDYETDSHRRGVLPIIKHADAALLKATSLSS